MWAECAVVHAAPQRFDFTNSLTLGSRQMTLVIFSLIAALLYLASRKMKGAPDKGVALAAKFMVPVATCLVAFGVYASCVYVVPAGHVGVVVTFGSVSEGAVQGLTVVNPFASVEYMSVQTANYTMVHQEGEGNKTGNDAIEVHGNDGMTLALDASIAYHLDPKQAARVYRDIGIDYADKIIRPESRSVLVNVATAWSGLDLYLAHRQTYQDSLNKVLGAVFAARGIVLENVLVRGVIPPASIVSAINSKKEAEQDAEKMTYVLARERKEAERKQVEAGGIAEFQRIVSQGISENLLKWKGIEATLKLAESPNSKVVVVGGAKDGLPVILGGDK